MGMQKAIFIDWDGTLSQSRFWQAWRDSPRDSDRYLMIEKALFEPATPLLQDWMLGRLAAEQVIDYLAERTGVASAVLLEALRESCETMKIAPGALRVVDKARAIGHKVFIATDNMDTFTHWTVPALDLHEHFDGILNSAEIGAFKKDMNADGTSSFFAEAFTTYDINPANTILVDDSPNTRQVEAFGMTVHPVSKPAETTAALERILEL